MPYTAKAADRLTFIKSMHTDAINHDPAVTLLQTGSQIAGRPSMGAWVSYGIGSETQDLPNFVVMIFVFLAYFVYQMSVGLLGDLTSRREAIRLASFSNLPTGPRRSV